MKKTTDDQWETISDFFVQVSEETGSRPMLSTPTFDVNIRLLRTNRYYWVLIDHIIRYMCFVLDQQFADYKDGVKGVSAVTLGIPFNIVVYKATGFIEIMINPTIVGKGGILTQGKSGCASMCLGQPVEVTRHPSIDVSFYDRNGKEVIRNNITAAMGGWLIQHEIGHCQGIVPGKTNLPAVVTPMSVQDQVLSSLITSQQVVDDEAIEAGRQAAAAMGGV